jgi:membrane protease YdiL (CAAX protease family)
MVLLFLVFYLPGYLWPDQDIIQNSISLGPYMLQFLIMAVPQILLLLYILQLRTESSGDNLRDNWASFGLLPLRPVDLLYALAIFAGIFTLLLIMGLILALLPWGGEALFSEGFRWKLRDARLVPVVLLFCLVTGYREELFFRSYLLTRFSRLSLPVAVGIGMSTLLFASGHVYQGFAGFAVAAVQGLYFSILFIRLKNIHPLAIAHGLYNMTVLVLSLFVDSGLPVQS